MKEEAYWQALIAHVQAGSAEGLHALLDRSGALLGMRPDLDLFPDFQRVFEAAAREKGAPLFNQLLEFDPDGARENVVVLAVVALRASSTEALRALLGYGLELEGIHTILGKQTLLCKAIDMESRYGLEGIVEAVLAAGADPDGPNGTESPLHHAVASCHVESVRTLAAAGADLERRYQPPGQLARDHTPLTAACFSIKHAKEVEVVQALLEAGADPNVLIGRGLAGSTPLLVSLISDIASGPVQHAYKLLLEHGADVGCSSQTLGITGYTPLHYAAALNAVTAVELLLAHAADADAQTLQGHTPLALAADNQLLNLEIVKRLVHAGAQIDIGASQSGTPVIAKFPADVRRFVAEWKAHSHHAMQRWVQSDDDTGLVDGAGRATPFLLAAAGLGLLPAYADVETWRELGQTEKAKQRWKGWRAAMPPVWQARMDAMDTTSLALDTLPETTHCQRLERSQIIGHVR